MKTVLAREYVVGPKGTLVTVGFQPPFALSLSKGQAELAEAFAPHAKGFDRLSPNGSLRTPNFAFGPQAETRRTRGRSRQGRWSN